MADFDAIVCGSGITGGWAAKELTERGLKVLLIERGRNLEHITGYKTEFIPPWQLPFRGYTDPKELETTKRIQKNARMTEWTKDMFVNDEVDIYETPKESGFLWLRGYHLGGRSLMWGRQCWRMSDLHFSANRTDGHGIAWPVGYSDIAPWYDHVEKFIGINGTRENIETAPDGIYQPPMGFNAGEQRLADVVNGRYQDRRVISGRSANLTQPIGDRAACKTRDQCARGCSFGAYFSTQSSTLPAARATGRLTLWTDTIVESLEVDRATGRVNALRLHDLKTERRFTQSARVIFLCTGAVNSVSLLLRSVSEATPQGVGNSSGLLGKYFLDQAFSIASVSTIPGIDDKYFRGRKPNSFVIPRFVNVRQRETEFLRGYSFQGGCGREGWNRVAHEAGVGASFKGSLRQPGGWAIALEAAIENLPRRENTISVDLGKHDTYGLPVTRIDVRWSENERLASQHAHQQGLEMLGLLGGRIIERGGGLRSPGTSIHEMGGACMGADPRTSVTSSRNQLHDFRNVFLTDGAFMCSTGDRNPSLTYMAFTARAANFAADQIAAGRL